MYRYVYICTIHVRKLYVYELYVLSHSVGLPFRTFGSNARLRSEFPAGKILVNAQCYTYYGPYCSKEILDTFFTGKIANNVLL